MELKFQVQIKIQKPVEDVFAAVYEPATLSKYFTNGGSSGPLEAGSTVKWAFEDTPGKRIAFPVTVIESVKSELIELEWASRPDGGNTRVAMKFEDDGPESTIVRISESGWPATQADLDSSYGNCMGWSQMLSALKAFTEYGIDLRKGAYGGLYDVPDKK